MEDIPLDLLLKITLI